MARRNRRKKPAQAASPAPQASSEHKARLWLILAGLTTIGVLVLSFAPFDQWLLGYVALTGWVVMVLKRPGTKSTVLLAWAMAGVYWLITMYWLWWVTLVGYFALVFYLSLYWLAAALLLRWSHRRGTAVWISLPIFWIALEYARAYVISGFPWFFLAQTQYRLTGLIQIASVTGQYGVSFFVAMVNGLVVDTLLWAFEGRKRRVLGRRVLPGLAACGAALAGMLLWGWLDRPDPQEPVVQVGVIQRAYPISLQKPGQSQVAVFDAHYTDSLELIETAAARVVKMDLLVWPESMLLDGMNSEFLSIEADDLSQEEALAFFADKGFDTSSIPLPRKDLAKTIETRRDARQAMRKLAELAGCPVLGGGSSYHLEPEIAGPEGKWVVRNSAMLFAPEGPFPPTYSKMQLVPFSEYVPFRKSLPRFHKFLRGFVPPVMNQLDPGREVRRFEISASWPGKPPRPVRIVTPICYEGTFARVCRRLVHESGRKEADLLVNISNDGWFVDPQTREGTTEQAQHLVHYVFRAVENRVPVARAVNTGISAFIDSQGRIRKIVTARVAGEGRGVMVEGSLLEGLRLDSRRSLYSLVGDAFAMGVSLAAVLMCAWWILSGRSAKEKERQK
jgi:apolipoprotein N-acyltransferase